MREYKNITGVINKLDHIGIGECYGTFGELLQGILENGHDFLVTFPINLTSKATFKSRPEEVSLTVRPKQKQKSRELALMILEHYDLQIGGELRIESNLPIGKGFASSSADMVATVRSIENCFGIQVPLSLLQKMMSQLETSDGVMYSGVVSFYNKKVELIEQFSLLPPITIVGVDDGGEKDTLSFYKNPIIYSDDIKRRYSRMLEEMTQALRNLDLTSIGRISLESAMLNQRSNPLKVLDNVISVFHDVNALGVIKAHTGTYSGILLSPDDPDYDYKLQKTIKLLKDSCKNDVTVFHSLSKENATHY